MRFLTGYSALSIEKRQCRAVLLNWIESSGTRKTKERGSKDRIEGKTKKLALVAYSHDANYISTYAETGIIKHLQYAKKVPKEEIWSKEKKQQWIIPSKHQLMTLG